MNGQKVLTVIGLVFFFLGVVSAAVSDISEATFDDFPVKEVTNDVFLNSLPLFSYCLNSYECASSYCGAEITDSYFSSMPNYCTNFCDSEGEEKGYNPCGSGFCYSLDSTVGYCVECIKDNDCDSGLICDNFECVEDAGPSETIKILTCSDLQNMNKDLDASYVLKRDIDCSGTKNWNGGKGFEPIGNLENRFVGSLDGNGYTISDLYINRSDEDYVGLFGYADSGNKIRDIVLEKSLVVGHDYVGGIVGYGGVEGSAINCSVYGNDYVGGLVGKGRSYGISFGERMLIFGQDYVGGIIGEIIGYDNVEGLYFNGNVSGNNYVGGLIGQIWTNLLVFDSYSIGYISGNNYVGGLVGFFSRTPFILNSYSDVFVSGKSSVGTLIGRSLGGGINDSFSMGFSISPYYDSLVIGSSSGTYSNIYFYNGTEQSPVSCLLYGTTDENCVAISNLSYFYDSSNAPMSSWDFENTWVEVQRGLPIFKWQAADKDCLNDNMCKGDKKCYNFECVNVADIDEGDADSNKDDGNKKNSLAEGSDDHNSDINKKISVSEENKVFEEEESIQLSTTKPNNSFFTKTRDWFVDLIESIKGLF